MNRENPAAAGAVLDEVHTLIPSDNIRINNNIQKPVQIIASVSLIDNKIKPALNCLRVHAQSQKEENRNRNKTRGRLKKQNKKN